MKLIGSPTSPYVRKARMVIIEKNLISQVEEVMVVTANSPPELMNANPLGKVPALVLEDGSTIIDSPVICDYLDSIAPGPRLMPQGGNERFEVMHLVAVADGIMDVAVAAMMERKRPEQFRYPAFIEKQQNVVKRSLDWIENSNFFTRAKEPVDMADIATCAALGYVNFRHADLEWQKGRPKLAKWFEEFSKRASVKKTEPKD